MNCNFPCFLQDFLKKFSDTPVEGPIENFSIEIQSGTTITFSVVKSDILHIHCQFKQVDTTSYASQLLYNVLLQENDKTTRRIAPLYWSMTENYGLSCSGYLFFDEENTESELLGILSILCSDEIVDEIHTKCIQNTRVAPLNATAYTPVI